MDSILNYHETESPISHIKKYQLIKGDAIKETKIFLEKNPQTIIALAYFDFDLYEPTKIALETFVPRMPKGAIIAFDELDNPLWPGETRAMIEFSLDRRLNIKHFPFDPYIAYAVID